LIQQPSIFTKDVEQGNERGALCRAVSVVIVNLSCPVIAGAIAAYHFIFVDIENVFDVNGHGYLRLWLL